MNRIILTLPAPCRPVSVNDVPRNIYGAHKMMKTWKYGSRKSNRGGADIVLRSQFNSQGMTRLTPPVSILIEYYFPNRPGNGRDRDNYSGGGSTKWLIDLLKDFAWKGDDHSRNISQYRVELYERETPSGEKIEQYKTVITIEEINTGLRAGENNEGEDT